MTPSNDRPRTGNAHQSTPPELLEGLDRLRGTGPEFHGFLANHGPMAAEAISVLGRPTSIGGWVEQYRALWEGRLDRMEAYLRELERTNSGD